MPSESERTYVWDVSSTDWGTCAAKGQFIRSSRFSCGGVDNLTLKLYPQGRESCPDSRPMVSLRVDAKLVATWKVTVETVGGEKDTKVERFASPSSIVSSVGRHAPPFRTVTVTLLGVWRALRPEEVRRYVAVEPAAMRLPRDARWLRSIVLICGGMVSAGLSAAEEMCCVWSANANPQLPHLLWKGAGMVITTLADTSWERQAGC